MKLLKEFKEFAVKGNMIDIAIGVIIGTAFNKVVDVLVKQVLMPPLSMLTDGISYDEKQYVLKEAVVAIDGTVTSKAIAIGYGKLLEAGIDFIVIAFTVFIVVKLMNSLKNKAEDSNDTSVKTPKNIELLTKITTLMEQQNILLEKSKNQE